MLWARRHAGQMGEKKVYEEAWQGQMLQAQSHCELHVNLQGPDGPSSYKPRPSIGEWTRAAAAAQMALWTPRARNTQAVMALHMEACSGGGVRAGSVAEPVAGSSLKRLRGRLNADVFEIVWNMTAPQGLLLHRANSRRGVCDRQLFAQPSAAVTTVSRRGRFVRAGPGHVLVSVSVACGSAQQHELHEQRLPSIPRCSDLSV